MADINLYPESEDDNPEDGYGLDDGIDGEDAFGTDDNLTPLQKLEKYMESDNVYTRQMVARGLLDTLRAVGDCDEQTTAVLTAMVKLSEDSDPIVRSELMEQVPHISVYCQENRDIFENAVPVYILPMVVRYLNDSNTQVRKTSQAALLVLLEQDLVDRADIEEQVVNVILELASPDSLDDYRTEAVALMSKLAPLLGRDMTERIFLSRFCEMCCDPLFHVRKVCAANFGDMCTVVSQACAEQQLLPKFYYLCEDGVWGVRKACAECFMSVSCACSSEVRKSDLASVFVSLLCDQSRWVRMAAFQQLGPFISTFADSDLTGITVADDGSLKFTPPIREKEKWTRSNKESEGDSCFTMEKKNDDQVVPEVTDQTTQPSVVSVNTNTSACTETPPTSPTFDSSDPSKVCDINSSQEIVEMEVVEDTVEDVSVPEQSDRDAEHTGASADDIIVEEKSVEEKRAEHYDNNNETGDKSTTEQSKDGDASSEGSSAEAVSSENTVSTESLAQEQNRSSSVQEAGEGLEKLESDSSSVAGSSTTGTTQSAEAELSSSHVEKKGNVHIHLDNTNINNFDSFLFWRTPLPELDLDLELVDGTPTNIHVTARVKDEQQHKVYASEMNVQVGKSNASPGALSDSMSDLSVCDKLDNQHSGTCRSESVTEEGGVTIHTESVSTISDSEERMDDIRTANVLGQMMNETTIVDGIVQGVEDINLGYIDSNLLLSLLPIADLTGNNMAYIDSDFSTSPHSSLRESLTLLDDATLAQQQDIVPQSLLENYLGMIDPSRAQTVDTEITKYCAYNLPAVAYTLGRENWHCIKNLYETLAADMQWKVRRTLAFSIHELAVILGEDITHRDLVPVFDGFLKDLDEVRIGILRHLADFLRLLSPDVRRQYLIKVQDFMNIDNQRNWRFRLELSEQLVLISELFSAQEISEYLLPLAMALAEDKVAEVRNDAFRLISVMLRRLSDSQADNLVQYLLNQLISRFAHNHKWAGRQIFAQLCQAVLQEESVSPVQFAKDFLPSLIKMKDDNVPNVRIALAKSMALYASSPDYFNCDNNPHHMELLEMLDCLRKDSDRDVRFYISEGQEEYPVITSLKTDSEGYSQDAHETAVST